MLKTRTWILLTAAAVLVLAVLSFLLFHGRHGSIVEIVQDGVVIEQIDLSAVTEAYSFVVEAPDGGSNTVLVQPGRICVSEADCPDHICMQQGWISDQAGPIVCLPHRLLIRLKGATDTDATTR